MGKMSHQKQSVTMGQKVTKWEKEHQAKMWQNDKMLLRDKMSQIMFKIGHKQDKL
jgi:hypothetical protein